MSTSGELDQAVFGIDAGCGHSRQRLGTSHDRKSPLANNLSRNAIAQGMITPRHARMLQDRACLSAAVNAVDHLREPLRQPICCPRRATRDPDRVPTATWSISMMIGTSRVRAPRQDLVKVRYGLHSTEAPRTPRQRLLARAERQLYRASIGLVRGRPGTARPVGW
jgi:hypothetical protein